MARKYTQKKRAEKQEETRARIAEAALDLHKSLGPNQTSISMVAEKAGVQRHTLYSHFPDERSLLMACSALHLDEDQPPDADGWKEIADRAERLKLALADIYSW
ncbi:MAG: TetR/AcrR family transcriptional regulator, partial [Alphaproteobacteria bacterium]|nr:TetR/AcrR family transcriptional regulator [Alphaproteobacteria bacterium]